MEVVEHSVLFFVGLVSQVEVTKHGNVDAELEIHFPIFGLAPLVRPTTLWHLGNTAPAWHSPKCMPSGAWYMSCPCYCKVCPLCNFVYLLAFSTDWTKFARNSYKRMSREST